MNRSLQLIVLSLAVCILSSTQSATARPCKSFLISSYSFSIKNPNPNFNNPTTGGFVTIVAEITANRRHRDEFGQSEIVLERSILPSYERRKALPLSFLQPRHRFHDDSFSHEMSSIRDRSKDILSVVLALLFGLGCGALTAATMYLVWSLFSNRHDGYEHRYFVQDTDDSEDDEISVAKKMGYVKISDAEATKPAKEVPSV